ncbi:MAG: aminopeptidase [Lachnospiraceae bacterium]|nr:aminopeptidase [Lachnospiraceae bacterium]
MEQDRLILDRIKDAYERISFIEGEKEVDETYIDYFETVAKFLTKVKEASIFINSTTYDKADEAELKATLLDLYAPAMPNVYDTSYLNPKYATEKFGTDIGRLLSFVYAELISIIPYTYDHRNEDIAVRLELFLELYTAFICAKQENEKPDYNALKGIVYSFAFDYQDLLLDEIIGLKFDTFHSVGENILMEADLNTTDYLYRYGEYISDNEVEISKFIATLTEEETQRIADVYTEGYRKGLEVTGKDISIKEYVQIYYPIGFERIIRKAVNNFKEMGLNPLIFRCASSVITGRDTESPGFISTCYNKQFFFDHEEDAAIWYDKAYVARRVEAYRNAYEKVKYQANHYGGPAVMEIFGEVPFAPQIKEECCHFSEDQQRLLVEFRTKATQITQEYVPGNERSFTIISFPVPEIGDKFKEIFAETVKLNTLDYELYRDMQQIIIDTLDKAEHVEVKGMNGNRTDLKVALHELKNPSEETNFENCVADVNIPVGEVFTSPRLKGTNGILHVTKVFLAGLLYKDLSIELKDGMIADYNCANFDSDEKNKKYIKDNILAHHDTIPIGEFAIGTNTVAYKMAEKFDIADRLTILIAEKTGPHFAMGDTCYSHEEEVVSYNPDGKRIIAKSNEVSEQYKTDPSKAYFGCHTDITIPYDELGSLTAVAKDGTRYDIIREGRFVLPGLEELNKPLDV